MYIFLWRRGNISINKACREGRVIITRSPFSPVWVLSFVSCPNRKKNTWRGVADTAVESLVCAGTDAYRSRELSQAMSCHHLQVKTKEMTSALSTAPQLLHSQVSQQQTQAIRDTQRRQALGDPEWFYYFCVKKRDILKRWKRRITVFSWGTEPSCRITRQQPHYDAGEASAFTHKGRGEEHWGA